MINVFILTSLNAYSVQAHVCILKDLTISFYGKVEYGLDRSHSVLVELLNNLHNAPVLECLTLTQVNYLDFYDLEKFAPLLKHLKFEYTTSVQEQKLIKKSNIVPASQLCSFEFQFENLNFLSLELYGADAAEDMGNRWLSYFKVKYSHVDTIEEFEESSSHTFCGKLNL